MKLAELTVENYRSITKATVTFDSFTVLIGQNNEGKSNLLSALVTAMRTIQMRSVLPTSALNLGSQSLDYVSLRERNDYRVMYSWRRDYPLRLQEKKPEGASIFRLTFSLEDSEIDDFDSKIGSRLNGSLPIEIAISGESTSVRVIKSGKYAASLTKKSKEICDFIGSRISVNYIPAVRTESQSLDVVGAMLEKELRRLDNKQEYKDALKTIADLQNPILEDLSAQITASLRGFLPQVKSVKIRTTNRERSAALARSLSVLIDDGNATPLERKGDGIKSLAAISLLQRAGERKGFASILAIEEPESHLHPSAIHRLRSALEDIAALRQVVITTHSPALVDRVNVSSNVIISKNLARSAVNVGEIRDLLGVRASDNLTHADLVLVVEGNEDKQSLMALIPAYSSTLGEALKQGTLAIDPIGGAGNLSYKLHSLYASLCPWHVLFDNDSSANDAIQKAERDGNLRMSDLTQTVCGGMPESEFEDCLDQTVYEAAVLAEFGIDLTKREFGGREKWSVRAKKCFESQGMRWTKTVSMKLKAVVADAVAARPNGALQQQKGASILAAFGKLERRLEQPQKQRNRAN